MASRSQGSKNLAEQRRKKEKAAAAARAEAAAGRRSRQKGKQGSGGSGTIVEGSAPPPTTGKANKGAGVRRAAAAASTATTGNRRNRSNTSKGELDKAARAPATATGRPRSVRKDVRNRDTAGESPTERAAANALLSGGASGGARGAARGAALGSALGSIGTGGAASGARAAGTNTRPSGKAAKPGSAAAVDKEWKAPKKGFFDKLGDKIKKATTLTPGRPRRPLGSRSKDPRAKAKYKKEMEEWRASQGGKKAGGRVGKPAKKAAKKRAHKETYVRPGALVPTKYRGKPLPVKGDANWAAFNADMQAFSQSKPPTATMRSKPRPKPTGMKAGGRVKTAARTSVKKKSPRRP